MKNEWIQCTWVTCFINLVLEWESMGWGEKQSRGTKLKLGEISSGILLRSRVSTVKNSALYTSKWLQEDLECSYHKIMFEEMVMLITLNLSLHNLYVYQNCTITMYQLKQNKNKIKHITANLPSTDFNLCLKFLAHTIFFTFSLSFQT
jgi:hypothetical protein